METSVLVAAILESMYIIALYFYCSPKIQYNYATLRTLHCTISITISRPLILFNEVGIHADSFFLCFALKIECGKPHWNYQKDF